MIFGIQKYPLFCVIKRRTAIHAVVRPHDKPRFHRVSTHNRGDSLLLSSISPFLHFHLPEILVLALLDFLEAEKVAISGAELVHEPIASISPFQGPERAIGVEIGLAIHVCEHVVGGDCDRGAHPVGEQRTRDPLTRRGVVGRYGREKKEENAPRRGECRN